VPDYLLKAAGRGAPLVARRAHGYRNAQATVLAPTGTIGFMMDCDTTGIEPDIALVKYKLLAGKGDGMMKIVNQTVPQALTASATPRPRSTRSSPTSRQRHHRGRPGLKDEHLPVFDCAFKPFKGSARSTTGATSG
jgi:ribonucleoside-diphosphate reductase alpha chain